MIGLFGRVSKSDDACLVLRNPPADWRRVLFFLQALRLRQMPDLNKLTNGINAVEAET
jgi:hypothetical protein